MKYLFKILDIISVLKFNLVNMCHAMTRPTAIYACEKTVVGVKDGKRHCLTHDVEGNTHKMIDLTINYFVYC